MLTTLRAWVADTSPRAPRRSRGEGPFLSVMLVVIVLLERFAVSPGGNEVPLVIPAVLAFLVVGLWRGHLRLHPVQTPLVLGMWATGLVCTLAQVATGTVPSVLSVGLLIVLYVPMLVRSTQGARSVVLVTRTFLTMMTIAAVVALVQLLIQYAGVENIDWLAAVVPDQLLVHGFFPNNPVSYGESLRRSNAVLFLEPSFLSMFLGLAVLLGMRSRAPWWQLLLLFAGMVPTLAGNGLVVLLPGLVMTLLSPLRRNVLSLVPGVIAAVVAAAATPLGSLYIGRTSEASSSRSSSSLRFVQPYTQLLPASFDSPFHALLGHGAGSSDSYLASNGLGTVTRALVPKVAYEYGMVGLIGIAAVLLLIMFSSLRSRPWLLGLVLAFFFLNASLLLAELVFATLFWVTLLPGEGLAALDKRYEKPARRHRVAAWRRLVFE